MVQWNDALSVGVAEIDNQHKELFNRINQLIEAMSQGKGKSEIDSVVAFLEGYVVTHFNAEEKLMTRANYPQLVAHKAEHVAFAGGFASLKSEISRSGASTVAVIQVHRRVVDWLTNHIAKSDQAFGSFVNPKRQSKAA